MEANENMASAITAIEAENAARLSDFSDALGALEAKIDAIPASEVADYSEITNAISDLSTYLNTQIEVLEASISATQEQN